MGYNIDDKLGSARSSVRIEQWFPKPRAGGSSPLGRTIVNDRWLGKCVVRHVIASPERVGHVGWGVWDVLRNGDEY